MPPQAGVCVRAALTATPLLLQSPVLEHQSASSVGPGGGALSAGSGAAEGQPAADWLSERGAGRRVEADGQQRQREV